VPRGNDHWKRENIMKKWRTVRSRQNGSKARRNFSQKGSFAWVSENVKLRNDDSLLNKSSLFLSLSLTCCLCRRGIKISDVVHEFSPTSPHFWNSKFPRKKNWLTSLRAAENFDSPAG
jgi:hypothetical protein